MSSTQAPVISSALSVNASGKDHLGSSTKKHNVSSRVVKESSKDAKKPRSLMKPKVLKSSAREPPLKSPLTTSVAASSRTPQGRLHVMPNSSLVAHDKATVASGPGRGRAKVGGAKPEEDKENTPAPLPVDVPKAHDILAEQVGESEVGTGSPLEVVLHIQIAAAVADSDGLEHVDERAGTPEGGQIHAFTDPISAMGKLNFCFSMTNHTIMCSLPHVHRN